MIKTLAERAREHAPKHRRQPPGFASAHADVMHQQRLVGEFLAHEITECDARIKVYDAQIAAEAQAAMSSS